MSNSPITARPLQPADVPAAMELAIAAGAQGVYVRNVLDAHPRLGSKAQFLAFYAAEQAGESAALRGLAYFGPRGNLLVLESAPGGLDPASTAAAIVASRQPWRIALGPKELVAAILIEGRFNTLVDREQVYYSADQADLLRGATTGTSARGGDPVQVRLAEKRDLDGLMNAALQLNQSDLRVDPWCVDKIWLRKSTKGRIRNRTTYVIGAVGEPLTKLDLGSTGPAGIVIEGVFTWPEFRGRGLAVTLVSAVAKEWLLDHPLACLHVASDNLGARRCYEKCGMRFAGSCQLALRA